MITYVICGVELDPDDYFEKYQVVKPPKWCAHRDTFEPSGASYCPECGKARPSETTHTYSRVRPGAFPEEAVQVMQDKIGTDNFEDEIDSVQDLESNIGLLPNKLSFYTNIGNSYPDKIRLFLGTHLTTIDRQSDQFCLQWTPETLQKLTEVVEGKVAEYGFEGKAKLVTYNVWM